MHVLTVRGQEEISTRDESVGECSPSKQQSSSCTCTYQELHTEHVKLSNKIMQVS